ncbi:MAG: LexA family transcriptional regulator [Opitutaceae bacterium]
MPKRRPNPNAEAQATVFREQLNQLIQEAGGIRALAKKCEITEGNIHHYLKGNGEPGMAVIAAIARGMNVSADRLLFGPDRPIIVASPGPGLEAQTMTQFEIIPELMRPRRRSSDGKADLSMGEGSAIAFHKEWISRKFDCEPRDLVYMYANDADMDPLIRVGEIMLINRTDALIQDGIYVLRMAEQITVKKLQFSGTNKAEVRAESREYRPWLINDPRMNTEAGLFGRVVWWGRSM